MLWAETQLIKTNSEIQTPKSGKSRWLAIKLYYIASIYGQHVAALSTSITVV